MTHYSLSKSFDVGLILPVLILLLISLTTLFSINIDYFKNQVIFVIISVVLFFLFSQFNYREFRIFSMPVYVASILALLFVLVLGIESRGAVRWIDILGFRIQFSEILKPFLALCLAQFLSDRNSTNAKTLLYTTLFLAPVALLIYKQPDLGNTLIYVGATLTTLIFLGFSMRYFLAAGALIAISTPFIWGFLHQYQRERILTFLHITNDPLGISYNAIQSIIAVGSGTIFGKGFGQGSQSVLRFLPERHTDFIFATLSEELGFIGSALVILAFSFLLYKLFVLFTKSDSLFSKLFIASTFSLFLLQFFINIGMNIGIIPVVGVTLPFMSYGGSSLVSNAIFLGIVSAMREDKHEDNVLEIT